MSAGGDERAPTDRPEPDTEASAPGQLTAGTRIADRYRIERLIGVGGVGMVYKAYDERLEVVVAIKLLRPELREDPELLERLRREVLLARSVSHANVLRTHDLVEADGQIFLSMDWVEGRSLAQVLSERGPLAPERAVGILRQLLAGLEAAHAKGVVHRDLKPGNILLDGEGHVYIADFGIARSAGVAPITQAGTSLGTHEYIAPEQAGGVEVDARSDLYAVGIILFEMLSGRLPFAPGTPAEVLGRRLHAEPDRLHDHAPDVPGYLDAICDRLLARDPQRRFASARQVLSALDQRRVPWRPPLKPLLAAVGVLLVLAAVGLAVRYWPGLAHDTGAAAVGTEPLAVLPFRDQTADAALAWTPAAVTDLLNETLRHNPELDVLPADGVRRTLQTLAMEAGTTDQRERRHLMTMLDARHLVSGSVRSRPDGLELAAVLHGPTGSQRLDPVPGDVAGLQDMVREVSVHVNRALDAPVVEPPAALRTSPGVLSRYSRGLNHLHAGNFLEAIPLLQQVTRRDPDYLPGWMALSRAYEAQGRGDDAVSAAEQAVRSAGDRQGRLALEARARLALLDGDHQTAIDILERLLRAFPGDTKLQFRLARTHGDAGHLDQSIEMLADVVESRPNHPRAWFLLSKYSILSGNARDAVDEYLVRALSIQNRLENRQGQAEVINAFGVGYEHLGQFREAASRYREAVKLRAEIADRRGLATSLRNLAAMEAILGQHDGADQHLERAGSILEQLSDRIGMAGIRNDRGFFAEQRGDFNAALTHYREALTLRKQLGDSRAIAESLNNVGFSYYMLGELDHAMVYWQQANDIQEEIGNRRGQIHADQSLALLQIAQGEWSAAAGNLLSTLESARSMGARREEMAALSLLARVALLRGRLSNALDLGGQALEIAEAEQDVRGEIAFRLLLARVQLALGDTQAAGVRLREAARLLEQSRNVELRAVHAVVRSRGSLLTGESVDLDDVAMQLALQGAGGEFLALEAQLVQIRAQGMNAERVQSLLSSIEMHGHVPLHLDALTTLATLALGAESAAQALAYVDEAEPLLRSVDGYYREWRLYATAVDAAGATGAGGVEADYRGRLRESLERMRAYLEPGHWERFSRRSEVAAALQSLEADEQ